MSEQPIFESDVGNGTYHIKWWSDGSIQVFRHGHPWRDYDNDKFMTQVLFEIKHLLDVLQSTSEELKIQREIAATYDTFRSSSEFIPAMALQKVFDALDVDNLTHALDRIRELQQLAEDV